MKKSYVVILLIFTTCFSNVNAENLKQPVDKRATKETIALYNRLLKIMNKGIMVGHQDALAYGHAWYGEKNRSDVKDITRDYPAVIGWELGHIELGSNFNLDSVYFSDIKKHILKTQERGGITTISWHANNIITGKKSWDNAQDSVVRSILPNGVNHKKYLKWLDSLATFFSSIKDKKGNQIPVIFRMFHENTGNWFWWGRNQCTPDEYKQLWIMTLNYLQNEKQIHNLLYCYSPSIVKSEDHLLERYPGDIYVDMIAPDIYVPPAKTPEGSILLFKQRLKDNLDIITKYTQKANKIAALGETGYESIPDTTFFCNILSPIIKEYKLSYILFWRNAWEPNNRNHYYLPFKGHPATNNFKQFYNEPYTLFLKDIRKIK